ncbi:P22 phage major capsid protein family protein [Telmatospirillum sp.]|uniref:P22 phage major capsid protein family protein n=1 Tax=Telmatospirillum sp. TaxID=2079197 RepID=UPI0028459214|nr:P22 phage major capsid protein family protein [Telmatospirillum sp.]MDR3439874.1 P22 phage major capsid protein family protein [Telmatospirillum sp.]
MPNAFLTPTAVTREALRVLHQKLNFIGNVNRGYDDQFAKKGAKIGDTLNVRLPNQYVYRRGPTLNAQDTAETSVPVQISNQGGVDLNFTSADLTLKLDDFSERILEPAMAVVAANMEADAFGMMLDVYNSVNNIGSPAAFLSVLQARKALNDNLTPVDNNRSFILNTQDNVDLVNALKGLFQDSATISKQYREGMMGRTSGFDFYENTILPSQATGTCAAATGYTISGANQLGGTLAVATGANTFAKGDIITLPGVYRVHPETKAVTAVLQPFVVTAPYAGGAGSLSISPAIVTSGGSQNVSASPANGGAITKIGAASGTYNPSLAFHRDAFVFATADLVMPEGVDFASRQVMDGLSIRIVRQYDINNDKFPCRLDVLYGFKTVRPQLACRILSN